MKIMIRICAGTLILGIIMIAVGFIMGPDYDQIGAFFTDHETYGNQIEYRVYDDVSKVSIDADDRNVIISTHDEDYVVMAYYHKDADDITLSYEDETIMFIQRSHIDIREGFNYKFPKPDGEDLYIILPKDLIIDFELRLKKGYLDHVSEGTLILNDVYIRSEQAYILMGDFVANDMNINVYDAYLSMKSFKAERVSIDIHKYHAHIIDAEVERLLISSKSSDVEIYEGSFIRIDGISESGAFDISEVTVSNTIDISSKTGDLNVSTSQTETIRMQTESGDIYLFVVATISYRMSFHTLNGEVFVNGHYLGQSYIKNFGVLDMELDTINGDIRVNTFTP